MSLILAQLNPPYATPGGAAPFKGAASIGGAVVATFTPTATALPEPAKSLYITDVVITNQLATGTTVFLSEGTVVPGTADVLPVAVGGSATVTLDWTAARYYPSGILVASTPGTVNIAVQGVQQ